MKTPFESETMGRDGLKLSIRREAGQHILVITRDNTRREETFANRSAARIRALMLGAQVWS